MVPELQDLPHSMAPGLSLKAHSGAASVLYYARPIIRSAVEVKDWQGAKELAKDLPELFWEFSRFKGRLLALLEDVKNN